MLGLSGNWETLINRVEAEREIVDIAKGYKSHYSSAPNSPLFAVTAPATDAARKWKGWGTALKPASEHWILVRKPLDHPNIASNVLAHGTGALNIDGCRVGTNETLGRTNHVTSRYIDSANGSREPHERSVTVDNSTGLGRWPANLVLSHAEDCVPVGTRRVHSDGHVPARTGARSTYMAGLDGHEAGERYMAGADGLETVDAWECSPDCPVAQLDRQSGTSKSPGPYQQQAPRTGYSGSWPNPGLSTHHGDSGGASRFFATFGGAFEQWEEPTLGVTSESPTAAGIEGGERQAAERFTGSLRTVGSGSKPTDPFCRDSRFTTKTSTPPTMTRRTLNSSPPSGTTTITDTCGKTIESSTELRNDTASGARGGSISASSRGVEPGPIKGIAGNVDANTSLSGEHGTENTGTPTTGSDVDNETPSRFFYTPKASTTERNLGLPPNQRNQHPTVKPIALLRYLSRLITPPSGTTLDPFSGTASTAIAAHLEGLSSINIEQDPQSFSTALHRISHLSSQPSQPTLL